MSSLIVTSWPAYKFLRRKVKWSDIPISFKNFPQFIVIHTVKGFGIVNETEVDFFSGILLSFLWSNGCRNLMSESSVFSQSIFHI